MSTISNQISNIKTFPDIYRASAIITTRTPQQVQLDLQHIRSFIQWLISSKIYQEQKLLGRLT